MRLRLPELMNAKGITNAHELAAASDGRISITSAYRLVKARGKLERMGPLLEALCDVLGVEASELLERENVPTVAPHKPATKRTSKAATPAKKAARKPRGT
jgi:DNA-binding Xre family transcriptional regulator